MKVTGTKKLLIVLFALVCAFTAGIGVIFARSVLNGNSDVAYAQEELPAGSQEQDASSDEEEISADEKETEENQDSEEAAEEAYDPRFDEGVIAEIARLAGLDSDFVNLYCHVRDIDANELLEAIIKGQEELRNNPDNEVGYIMKTPDGETEGSLPEEKECILDDVYGDMHSFANDYYQGTITVSEDEDYFVAPDAVSVYATYYYVGYNASYFVTYNPYKYYRSTNGGTTWSSESVSLSAYFDSSVVPSHYEGGWYIGDQPIWDYCGQRTVITLAPGEIFKISCKRTVAGQYLVSGGNIGSTHWSEAVNYGWNPGDSHWVIDGDTPSGTEMVVYNSFPTTYDATTATSPYQGKYTFFTWNSATYNCGTSSSYASKTCKYLCKVYIIQRTEIEKPQLVNDATLAGDSVSGNTKTAYFRGKPVTISMSPDFGAGLIDYAFYKDAGCTIPDDSVSLVLRSMHGVEGVAGTKLTFRSSVAGKHYIRLRIIQPPASPYLPSTAMKWSDGSNTPITFILDIQLQKAQRPQIVYDAGVAANGKSKTVNYTGEEQTITFTNADKLLVNYSTNGLYESTSAPEWGATDDSGVTNNTLVLAQTERGTYTINLYIQNTAGCVWADTGTTEMIQFTFYIKEMLIDRTLNLDDPSVFNITTDYTGVECVLEVGPAVDGQLIVIAPGVSYSYLEKDDGTKYLKFSVTDAGTQEIIIRPAKGYIWKDTKDQATITYTITINAIAIDFPTLLIEDGCDYSADKRTKNIVFDPSPGWQGTIVIQNIPKQAISELGLNTAMAVKSWVPSEEWFAEHGADAPYIDADCTVLTLVATSANTYPVIVSITDPNYSWKLTTSSAEPRTFNLFIDKFELYAPTIAGDVRAEWGGAVDKNPLISDAKYADFVEPDFDTVYPGEPPQKKIEGLTKTVYFNNDPEKGNATPDAEKYFRLYAGGFTANNQVTIDYSKNGLVATWPYTADGVPFLNLKGSDAGNYIINITPTSNYRWTDGTTDMKSFKFVIIPIFRDSLEMFIQTVDGNNWNPISTFDGSVTFDGEEHKFRIGNWTNPSQNFDSEQMTYALVDGSYNVVSTYPVGFTLTERVVDGVNILEGTAVHAGVYVIRLQLKNENYSWRQGKGIDMYYTVRVTAKSLKNPVLLAAECSGGAGQKVEVVDDEFNHYVYGGYNGNEFQMVIGFALEGMSPDELILDYNPSGIDFDPEDGSPALWGNFNSNVDEVGLTRLIVKAKIVGTHTLVIELKNNDFKWAAEGKYYEFQLIIDAAQVDFVNFYYGDPDTAVLIGSDNANKTVDYDPDPEKLHQITVMRADNDFDTTSFESMFTFQVSYDIVDPDYEIKKSEYNFDNLVLSFKDANTYYIDVYLTHNYIWKKEYNRPETDPVRMVFIVTPKQVDIPLIIDEGEKDEDGNSIASVDNSTFVKTVTYDTNTLQSIALALGENFRAFEVDTALSTSFLKADPNVTPLRDKKLRYTAKSAGTYVLVIKLTDTNNYTWSAGVDKTYTLEIQPRSISVPQAFFIHNKDITDPHYDYLDIMTGAKGSEIEEDTTSGKFERKEKYTGDLQYVYLFGYAIENSEVNISVSASDPSNASGLGHQDVSPGGEVKGHFIYAKYVNVYTITVEFKLSAEFSTPNCNWQSISMGTDVLPREFYLEIEKNAIALPELVADPTQAWVPDSAGFDSLTQKFTYDGADKGPSIEIANCLDMSPVKYMEYGVVNGLTDWRLDTSGTHILTFFILNTATVGTEYKLRISLDAANECWDTTVTDDVKDRYVYIVIEKKGIARPEMVIESDGATYSTTNFNNDTKTVDFDASKSGWPNAMKISGFDTQWMSYANSKPSDKMSSSLSSGEIQVSVNDKNCDTYSVIVTLKNANTKWDGTTDDSSPAEFMFVIAPKQYTRPVIDSTATALLMATGATINAEDCTTTYLYTMVQKFVINNYIDDASIMTVDISTGKKFDFGNDVSEAGAGGPGTLTYGAEGAGVYKVVIKPSQNATWATGDPGDIVFTLTINKREYQIPTLDQTDASTTIVYSDPLGFKESDGTTAINDTKTLPYILNTWQDIIIDGFDSSTVMVVGGVTAPDGFELKDQTASAGVNQLKYSALNSGTYTITVKIRDDLSPNNCFNDSAKSASITFTFKIEKQKLAIPVFDPEAGLLQSDETVNATGDTFTVLYDGTRHANLLLNVLGNSYMTYLAAADDYNNGVAADRQFKFASSPTPSMIGAGKTIDDVYRDGVNTKPNITGALTTGDPDKVNYIRIDAVEPGTYKLLFDLSGTTNFVWSDNTDTTKTVTFIVNKVRVAAPEYMAPPNNSKPYTGSAIEFKIRNVFGATGDGISYIDGAGNPATAPSYIFEEITAKSTDNSDLKEIKIVSLDTTNNILTVSAVEIGTYTVTVSIKESEKSHVEWTTAGNPTKTLTFTITRRGIQPTITFEKTDGTAISPALWPKDVDVNAVVTFTDISVTKNVSGQSVLDLDLLFNIYYKNLASLGGSGVNPLAPLTDDVKNALAAFPQTATDGATLTSGDFTVECELVGTDLKYNLIYKYLLVSGKADEQINMGSYRVFVDGFTAGSNSYTFINNTADFDIEALKAPFDERLIQLELYKLSNPNSPIRRYTLEDVFGAGTTKVWSDMTAADAIELDYLEAADDYGFRFVLDDFTDGSNTYKGMYGPAPVAPALPDGETTFDQTSDPATTVLEALNRWQVKWTTNGTYGKQPTARYAGDYSFTVTLAALDSLKFSYATQTFEFFYKIKPVLYDLKDLHWNYTTGTTQYIYDGTAKTVELIGTFPDGLTVGSYVVTGYDRNSQISAKHYPADLTDPLLNYNTTLKFANSNPNYVTPDMNDPSSYLYNGLLGGAFPWTIVWSIEKAPITDLWQNTLNDEGSASAYIPTLQTHGSKVDYTYYRNDSGVWTQVTSFEHTGTVQFKVVATLKSNPSDPALDYANNYTLTVTNSTTLPDTLEFFLGPGNGVNVDVVIRSGDADASTLTGGDFGAAPLPSNNVFVYDGEVFDADFENFMLPGGGTITVNNLVLTYYNVSNKFRPIAAPTDPGHYMIKVQFKNLPDDGNDYTLQFTEYYFDIEKGTFDPADIYWRYTHTDSNGFYTEARYDDTLGKWIVFRDDDSTPVGDGTWTGGKAGMAIDFVYDGAEHTVELFYGPSLDTPPDNSLLINMKSGSVKIDANTKDEPKYTAIASFSFNGKLWNDPVVTTTMDWVIEQATIDLTGMSWDYPAAGYTYTRVNGEEQGFNVLMQNVDPLLANYISYKFYKEEKNAEDKLEYKDQGDGNILTKFTKAGNYRTQFIIDKTFATENPNYKLGPNPLADPVDPIKNPDGLISTLDWSIAVRDIDVPTVSGAWTEFDGREHNMLTAYSVQTDWEEYYTIKIQYKAVGETAYVDYDEKAEKEFGSEYSAMHAGDYRMLFRIKDGINSDVQTNVQWRKATGLVPPYEFIVNDYVNGEYKVYSDMTITKAEISVDYWNTKFEDSTVELTTVSGLDPATLNKYVDYVFFDSDGTSVTGTTPYGIDHILKNPGTYAIEVYVLGKYKDKEPNFDINDFTNDITVKAGIAAGQELYYIFTTAGTGPVVGPRTIPNLVYISGYIEEKDTGDVYHGYSYSEWQKMMVDQGLVDTSVAGFDWTDVLGPSKEEDAEAYEKFYNPKAADSTYDLAKHIEIAKNKAKVAVDAVYQGYPITFVVNGWNVNDGGTTGIDYWDDPANLPTADDTLKNVKYVDNMDIWQGEFRHDEVGKYSATLLLKKTADGLCWSYTDTNSDGVIDDSEADRSSVKLTYSISYRTINPHADAIKKHLPTYNGSEYSILQYAWDLEYGDGSYEGINGYDDIITKEFKDYVEIKGTETATKVGKYTVYLKIKDEYFNTVHWYVDGNPKGQPGTFKIEWEILPIYVEVPHKVDYEHNENLRIVYDKKGHSVFEVLEGYEGGSFAENSDLGKLLQVTTISGDRGINATLGVNGNSIPGVESYQAKFVLPDSNYAWIDSSVVGDPVIDDKEPSRTVSWDIYQKELDLSNIAWGYVDDEGKEHEVKIVDGKAEFQYTVEDGVVQPHELRLIGVPEVVLDETTYLTDGLEGSTRTDIGSYHTYVYFGKNSDVKNYYLAKVPEAFEKAYATSDGDVGDYKIDWKITERMFAVPTNCEVPFDGTVREILDLFKDENGDKIFGEGWENYLNVTIEYKPLDAADSEYVNYFDVAGVDEKLDYSMYNVYYLGDYRLKFSIKSELNAAGLCVVWVIGTEKEVVDHQATLSITPLELVIDGWTDDPDHAESYVIVSEEYDALSDDAKEVFKYIVKDQATGKEVAVEDIPSRGAGIYYTIEFVIADGNDYAKDLGMKIICASGVDNPYEFCTDNYSPEQSGGVTYWLPKPVYSPTTVETYNGVDKEYTITNWSDYEIPASYLSTFTDVDLSGKTHFIELAGVIGENADCVTFDPSTGKIKVSKAGDFTLNFRFIPGLNLSWFDSPYSFVYPDLLDGSLVPVTGPALDALVDKKAYPINIKIEKASVPQITAAQLEYYASLIKDIEFTGYEINLKEREDTKVLFDILKTSYGSLIDFEGYKATAAGEYKLIIKLKDSASSYWDLNIKEEVIVNDKAFDGYDDSFKVMWIEEGGKWVVAYVKPDGKGGYVKYNDGNYSIDVKYVMQKVVDAYVLADGLLDEDGRPETASGAKYAVDENGLAIRYSLVDGKYVEDASGNYLAKYKLMADQSIMEMPVIQDGKNVIDTENTLVKIVRDVTSTDPYEITWRITADKLATPTVNEDIVLTYNGKEQSAESVLKGFNSTYMEIVEGGVGKNAGEYTAKIKVKDTDHRWSDPEETIDGVEYVYVKWTIEKADIDLSNAQWAFTDGTNVYPNGEGMVYTRKDGKAVVYWAELVNIPEALKGAIIYTTNGHVGAYAGRDAGRYTTSFKIDPTIAAVNFNSVTKPDSLPEEVTWNIQRRMLEIPSTLGSFTFIFDDAPHDLLAMIGVPEDWAEYYTIEVMYAKNFIVYTAYEGHDGNPYEAYGAGGYKFVFDIISGINTNKDMPNVVWLKSSGQIEVPVIEESEQPEEKPQVAAYSAVEEVPVVFTAEEEVVGEVVEEKVVSHVEEVKTQTVKHTPTVVEVVCDRLKKLSYGAELQLKSRKYLR